MAVNMGVRFAELTAAAREAQMMLFRNQWSDEVNDPWSIDVDYARRVWQKCRGLYLLRRRAHW
jgi:hypothetical protein